MAISNRDRVGKATRIRERKKKGVIIEGSAATAAK